MTGVKVVVISAACIEAVNRAVYRLLSTRYRIDLHLAVPTCNRVGAEVRACCPIDGEPFPVTLLKPIGFHARVQRLKGLRELVRTVRPSHVIVDADPATVLVRDVVRATHDLSTRVWCVTCENLDRDYIEEAFEGLRCGHPGVALGGLITWWLWRSSRDRIDHVFALSREGVRVMSKLGFADRITQIPLGVDPGLFFPQSGEQVTATRRLLGLDSPTVAYFGRLIPEKGVDILLKALAGLKDLRWQLLLDNCSTYRSAYVKYVREEIERLGLRDRVIHFDATHDEMPDYMNAADIVVLPSVSTPKFKEQYGRVIVEAMACGKIVVGSRSGAIPDLIQDCGFLFPEGDIHALTDHLRYLLTTPADGLRPMRMRAVHWATTGLSIERQAQIWWELLKH